MPILSTSEIIVNTTTAGSQVDPAILVLENGNTVIAWTDGASVSFQQYSANGVAFGAEVVVASGLTASRDANLTKTASGGFIVTWSDSSIDLDVYGASYDGAGAVVTAATALVSMFGNQYNSTTTTLADGNIVLVWTEGGTVSTQVYSSSLVAIGVQVDQFDLVSQSTPSVVVLSDGSFVVSYAKSIAGSNEIVAQVYSADGTAVGDLFVINSATANNQHDPQLVALENGGFIAAWHTDPGTEIRARIMNADGTAVSAEFAVNSTNAGTMKNATIAELADGRIAIVWEGNGDVRGRLFNSNGVALGDDFVINADTSGQQTNPKIVALADGRFTVTYTSGDGADTGIRTVTMDPDKFFGTIAADVWNGGEGNDTIYGYASGDTLSGNGGNDFINGGVGNDTLNGDAGNDTLYGEDGDDTLNGGIGNDVLFAGAAATATGNKLNGGDGDDIMYAGSGKDTFDGGIGADTVSYYYGAAVSVNILGAAEALGGAAAGDVFNGLNPENLHGSATGNDTLIGSNFGNTLKGFGGNDTLTGNAGVDRIYGGTGDDTISGGIDIDYLYGESGDDTVSGGDGNDTVYSGAGADTQDGGLGIDTLTYFSELTGANVSFSSGIGIGTGSASGDTSTNFENLYGSNIGGDTLIGNTLANNIRGYGGNDYLHGSSGADTLDGGTGNDYLNGGSDADKLSGGLAVGSTDTYYGSSGRDSYVSNTSGIDIYRFASVSDVSLGVEAINSFNATVDQFQFFDSGFTGLSAGAVTDLMFLRTTNGTHVAATAAQRFIFDDANNTLYYDNDGSGASAAVAVVKFSIHTGTFNQDDISII